MVLPSDYPAALGPYARTMPILLTHGTADATVPYEYGQGSAGLLKQMVGRFNFLPLYKSYIIWLYC
jgi:predicted esterase